MSNEAQRFTNSAKLLLASAQEIATKEFKTNVVTPTHILLAMTRDEKSSAYKILDELGIVISHLTLLISDKKNESNDQTNIDSISLSDDVHKVLANSVDSARRHGSHQINSIYLLMGLVRSDTEEINILLKELDIDPDTVLSKSKEQIGVGTTQSVLDMFKRKSKRKNSEK